MLALGGTGRDEACSQPEAGSAGIGIGWEGELPPATRYLTSGTETDTETGTGLQIMGAHMDRDAELLLDLGGDSLDVHGAVHDGGGLLDAGAEVDGVEAGVQ